jgi:hypothetical protein
MMGPVDDNRMDAKQILGRLVGRYGQTHGLYLFGEVCLLQTLGFDAFRARHTDLQLRLLAEQLRPLALWPETDPAMAAFEAAPDEAANPLLAVARSLLPAPLVLALGPDLFHAWLAWAEQSGAPDAWFEPARAALVETLGFVPPRLLVTLGEQLPVDAYRLYLNGEAVEEGQAFIGQDLVLGPEQDAPPALPYPWRPDPAGHGWVAWMPVGPEADVPDLPRLHWLTAVSRHLSAALPRHADRLLSVPRVLEILRSTETAGYDRELERYVSLPELKLVFETLLRQGLSLRPLAPMLESIVTAILADLAKRTLSPTDIERLNRQLPAFSTPWLVAAVRRGMGLPETAPPKFAWSMREPLSAPDVPVVSVSDRAGWQAVLQALEAERPYASFWLASLRQAWPRAAFETGDYMALALVVPVGPAPAGLRVHTDAAGVRKVAAVLADYVAIARPLARLEGFLAGRGTLDAETRVWLDSADFATARHLLARPRRLAEAHGAVEAVLAHAGGGMSRERV